MKSHNHRVTSSLVYGMVLALFPAGSHAAWELIDDMESGASDWTSQRGDTNGIAADPADASNKVYRISGENIAHRNIPQAYRDLGGGIANGTVGTLFFRVRTTAGEGLADWVTGSSAVMKPSLGAWHDFEGYFSIAKLDDGPLTLNARNGDAFTAIGTILPDIWYNVWLVLDNGSNTYSVHYNTGSGIDATESNTIHGSGFAFRNGTTDALNTMLLRLAQNGTHGYIDDIYLDKAGNNLTNPLGGNKSAASHATPHTGQAVDAPEAPASPMATEEAIPGKLTTSQNAPRITFHDISNLVPSIGTEPLAINAPGKGNTFMSDKREGMLKAVTVRISSESGTVKGGNDFIIRIGTVTPGNPSVFTQVASSKIKQESDVPSNSFFTFELGRSVTLKPNTLHAFQILLAGSQIQTGQSSPVLRVSEDSFRGGHRFSSSKSSGGQRDEIVFNSGDLVFHLEID